MLFLTWPQSRSASWPAFTSQAVKRKRCGCSVRLQRHSTGCERAGDHAVTRKAPARWLRVAISRGPCICLSLRVMQMINAEKLAEHKLWCKSAKGASLDWLCSALAM